MSKELNNKLGEWASVVHFNLDFTNSLDACFKWLAPKYIRHYEDKGLHTAEVWHRLFSDWLHCMVEKTGKDYALALCLVIEKLIDSEVVSATSR